MFKMIAKIVLLVFVAYVHSLPQVDQNMLANSLIANRENMDNWDCSVCSLTNKPLSAIVLDEDDVHIKIVLAQYPSYAILSFTYVNITLQSYSDIIVPQLVSDAKICKDCKIQKVFNDIWENIEYDISRELNKFQIDSKTTTLYLTGIGPGGSVATYAYLAIEESGLFTKMNLTTFGANMVGNQAWAAYFDAHTGGYTTRYTAIDDLAPYFPACVSEDCNMIQTGVESLCDLSKDTCTDQPKLLSRQKRIPNFWLKLIKLLKARNIKSVLSYFGYDQFFLSQRISI